MESSASSLSGWIPTEKAALPSANGSWTASLERVDKILSKTSVPVSSGEEVKKMRHSNYNDKNNKVDFNFSKESKFGVWLTLRTFQLHTSKAYFTVAESLLKR